ncbi:MAG: hypothetical protein ACE5GJ_08765 [Gemmatimonadota bacterium]
MSDQPGRGLTRSEFDAVIRRAAELAMSDGDARSGELSEGEVIRIAREVGLSEAHVRRAMAEMRAGKPGVVDRVFGPTTVTAVRVVPGTPEALARELDDFFTATRFLQRVRKTHSVLQYRPALDWASQIARAASFTSRKYYVASARSVEVALHPTDPGTTLLEVRVDPGTRGDSMAGGALGAGVVGLGVGVPAGIALAAVWPLVAAVSVGAVVAGTVGGGITYLVGRSHKRKLLEVQAEVEGILDALELGESLEPPPPSWRRWVRRQFHGVARDILGADEEEV